MFWASEGIGIPFLYLVTPVKLSPPFITLLEGISKTTSPTLPALFDITCLKVSPLLTFTTDFTLFSSTSIKSFNILVLGLVFISLVASSVVLSSTCLASGASILTSEETKFLEPSYICWAFGAMLLVTKVENLAVLGSNLCTIPGKNSLAADKTFSLGISPFLVS